MSTITLPNIRVSSDLTVKVRLKDSGVAIDWSTLQNIKACIYSDAQRALAGRCAFSIDEEDNTLLVCTYAANKPQYLGVNRIVISAKYMGETKTYDKPAFSFVRWTADQEGEEITIDDPDVDVEIDVEDISSSILQEAVDAAFTAADRANEAAEAAEHMVDIHTGPEGKSAYEVAVEEGYTGTEEEWLASLKGDTGETPDISIGTVTTVAPGTPASASMTGTPEEPVLNLSIPQGVVGATPNFTVGTVTTGEPGSSVIVTITGTPEAPVLNVTIPQGMQGNTGSSVDYPYELVNNLTTNDATKGLSAAQGVVLDGKVSQLEAKVTDLDVELNGLDYEDAFNITTSGAHSSNNDRITFQTPIHAGKYRFFVGTGTTGNSGNVALFVKYTGQSSTTNIGSLAIGTSKEWTLANAIESIGVYMEASVNQHIGTMPLTITSLGSVTESIETIEEKIEPLDELVADVTSLENSVGSINSRMNEVVLIGNNNTGVKQDIDYLVPGGKYRIFIKNPSWDKSGITNKSVYILSIESWSGGTKTILAAVSSDAGGVIPTINGYYDILVPDNYEFIRIFCRATLGEKVYFEIVNTSAVISLNNNNGDVQRSISDVIGLYNNAFLLNFTSPNTTNGITITKTAYNEINVSGTATANVNVLISNKGYSIDDAKTHHVLMECSTPAVISDKVWCFWGGYKADNSQTQGTAIKVVNQFVDYNYASGIILSRIQFHIDSGTTLDNVKIRFYDYEGQSVKEIDGAIDTAIEGCKRDYNNLFIGAGNTFASTVMFLPPGRHLRLRFFNPNWDKSGVTVTGVWLLLIVSVHNGSNTNLIQISIGNEISPYYDFTVPNDSDYILVGGRAAIDVPVRFVISDISDGINGLTLNEYAFSSPYNETNIKTKSRAFASLLNGGVCETLMFMTDPHLMGGSGTFNETSFKDYIGLLIKYYNETPVDWMVCGGDWLNNGDTQNAACWKLGYADATMRKLFKNYYPVLGNHDTNYQGVVSEEDSSRGDFAHQSIVNLMFRENGNTYYEWKGNNTRFFVLDAGLDWTPGMDSFRWEQIAWLAENLLQNEDEHIILLTHIYYNSGTSTSQMADNLQLLAGAFNDKTSVELNGVTYDFTSAVGRVHCIISGHTHADHIITENVNVPVWITTHLRDGNTPTFDLLFIDYTAGKMKSIRVGTGNDREMNLA